MPPSRRPPELVVIGAMKCGTRALHAQLDRHPQIAMAPQEVNFFFGPQDRADGCRRRASVLGVPAPEPAAGWRVGQWARGADWYLDRFDPAADVRGDVSPGYTDPAHPQVAERLAALAPEARLVYLVRDPVSRAASQWAHHVRDRTERRPVEEAVLDPDSQYLARSRYHERLEPFLRCFRREQVLVVLQERLLADRAGQLRRVFGHLGVDADWWDPAFREPEATVAARTFVPRRLRSAVWEAVADDVSRLRAMMGDPLREWQDPVRASM